MPKTYGQPSSGMGHFLPEQARVVLAPGRRVPELFVMELYHSHFNAGRGRPSSGTSHALPETFLRPGAGCEHEIQYMGEQQQSYPPRRGVRINLRARARTRRQLQG